MFKIVFAIFMFFAELPITLKLNFNFWFWILFFVAPVLTFCVGPERSTILHIARVICAVGLTFSLLNLALGTYQSFQWRDYHACLAQTADIAPTVGKRYDACSPPHQSGKCAPGQLCIWPGMDTRSRLYRIMGTALAHPTQKKNKGNGKKFSGQMVEQCHNWLHLTAIFLGPVHLVFFLAAINFTISCIGFHPIPISPDR